MPESKAELLASVNEAAGLVQKVFFTYLLVSLYLAILIGSTTHEQMLRESGVQLPLFGVPLSVFWVYAIAPWLYLALHVNLLVQHYLLSRKLHAFNRALRPLSKEEADEWRVRLYPSMFAQMLAGTESRYLKRFVLQSIVFTTVAVAPVVLLLWMQIRFLPYHSELVTWGNRLALIVDLVMLWYYWPLMMVDEDVSWRQVITHERPLLRSSVCAVVSFGVLLVSLFVAVVPGGRMEWLTFETRWSVAATCDAPEARKAEETWIAAVVPECLRAPRRSIRSCLQRHLDVREAKLLAEEPHPEVVAALVNDVDGTNDDDMAETMRERTIGLVLEGRDLRGADFRHADLTKADLAGAELDGANLGCAKLDDANLSTAELRDANLNGAALRGAILSRIRLPGVALSETKALGTVSLKEARLIGADLNSMDMDGASLSNAELQGASLQGAKLRGADLRKADLRGANLRRAQLQGADLFDANLQGADLRWASLGGANFDSARLGHADLRDIKATDGKIDELIDILSISAAHGDVLAEAAVERLKRAAVDSIDLSEAKELKSIRCGKSSSQLKLGEVKCLDDETIEEYRRRLVKDVLVPLFCRKKEREKNATKEELFDAEARALLAALYARAALTDEDEDENHNQATEAQSKGEKPALVEGIARTQTTSGDGTMEKSRDVARPTRLTTLALSEALRIRKREDCLGREVFAEKGDFETTLQHLDLTQRTK